MSKYADVAPTIIGATSQTDEQIDAKIDALETVETVDNTPVIDQSKIAAFNSIALEGTPDCAVSTMSRSRYSSERQSS
jgi:hypothetical protein